MISHPKITGFVRLSALFLLFAGAAPLAAQTIEEETPPRSGGAAAAPRDADEESGAARARRAPAAVAAVPAAAAETPAVGVFDLERRAFALVNRKRAENGLDPLEWDEDVARIARLHTENMAKFNFFSHRGLDGKMIDDRADSLGIKKWSAIGENIAYNRGFKDPVETAVEKWMLSSGHRENILNRRWRQSALAIAVTDDGTYYFTQVFMVKR